MDEHVLNRRELLAGVVSLTVLGSQAQTYLKSTEPLGTRGICILGKYWREQRWDCFSRFYDVVKTTYQNIDLDILIKRINETMKHEANNIHFIEVTDGWNGYYVHFKYIGTEMALAVPVAAEEKK